MLLGLRTFAPLGFNSLKVDSSEYITFLQSCSFQSFYFLQKRRRFLTIRSVSRGFLAAIRDGILSSF
jgi:hypothetical protein